MAERHDSTTEQGCFEAGREVGEWVGGGGQQRWQQSGGWWDFPRCSSAGSGAGAGCRRSRLVQRIDVSGTGLGWTGLGLDGGTGDSRAARGPRGKEGRRQDWGGPLWQGRGRCGAAAQRGCSKKGDGMGKGQAQGRWAGGRRSPNRISECRGGRTGPAGRQAGRQGSKRAGGGLVRLLLSSPACFLVALRETNCPWVAMSIPVERRQNNKEKNTRERGQEQRGTLVRTERVF